MPTLLTDSRAGMQPPLAGMTVVGVLYPVGLGSTLLDLLLLPALLEPGVELELVDPPVAALVLDVPVGPLLDETVLPELLPVGAELSVTVERPVVVPDGALEVAPPHAASVSAATARRPGASSRRVMVRVCLVSLFLPTPPDTIRAFPNASSTRGWR